VDVQWVVNLLNLGKATFQAPSKSHRNMLAILAIQACSHRPCNPFRPISQETKLVQLMRLRHLMPISRFMAEVEAQVA
jgi:hypothetical protein